MSRNVAYDKLLGQLVDALTGPGAIWGFGEVAEEEIAEKYRDLTAKMLAVYEAKDTDYSENDLPMGNMRESASLGIAPWKGVLLRIGDKKRRIGSFVKRANYLVKDEGVDDTLVDLGNYSLLGLALWDEAYTGETGNITFGQWSSIRWAWFTMAIKALQARMLYEYRNTPGAESWAGDAWQSLNQSYDALSAFSCENNAMSEAAGT